MSLSRKIILMTVSILFISLTASSAVVVLNFKKDYEAALLTGTYGLGQNLHAVISELLSLGLPLDSLSGLERKCRILVENNRHIAYVGISNRAGKVLYHSDPAMVGSVFMDHEMRRSLAAKEPFTQLYHRFDGLDYYDVTLPIYDAGHVRVGQVRLGFRTSVVTGKVVAAVVNLAVTFLVSFAVTAFLINYLLSRIVSRPVIALAQHAQQIAKGDFGSQTTVSGTGEIALLSESLNFMSSTINEQVEALRQSHAELENLVASRTEELARANDGLKIQLADRIRAEEKVEQERTRFEKLISSSPIAVGISTGGILRYGNDAHRKLSGLQVGDPAIKAYVHPDDRKWMVEKLTSEGRLEGYEMQYYDESRRPTDVLATFSTIEYDGQEGIIGWLVDISHLKQMQKELSEAKDAAEAANRAKTAFLANMSHEIRTPMNAILGYAQLIRRDHDLSASAADYTDIIIRSGNHLLGLINDILEMSKIESGRVAVSSSYFDIQALLCDIEAMFRVRAVEKSLRLELRLDPSLPLVIAADVQKVRQVVINLLSNALKFTDTGGVVLSASSSREGSGPLHSVRIEVRDTGCGILPEELPRVFAPFEQSSSARDKGGTGLGMAISRQYARLMGGEVAATSTPGGGSTFTFTFPAEAGTGRPAQVVAPSEKKIIGLVPGGAAPKVLVVDDLRDNRSVLRLLLEGLGFSVIEAADGAEAVASAEKEWPDVVLMDRRMPVMDGLDATLAIKSIPNRPVVPVIVVSASALEEDRQEALDACADGFVRKPYRENEILEEIRRVVPAVRYVYDEGPPAAQEPVETRLLREAVQALPPTLVTELVELIEAGDVDTFDRLLDEQVSGVSRQLYDNLRQASRIFDYRRILDILVQGERNG